jgi:hypothetical protein
VAPAAPCDQFLWRPVGLNRSAARACHFCPAAPPRTFLRLAAVTLTIGRPLSAAASSVIASALITAVEYDDKTLQEFCQIGSGARLEPNRRDRLDHESFARACGLRDDHGVLSGAHSEDHPRILAEAQVRVKSRPLVRRVHAVPRIRRIGPGQRRSDDRNMTPHRSPKGDGSLPIIYPASLGHELDQNSQSALPVRFTFTRRDES